MWHEVSKRVFVSQEVFDNRRELFDGKRKDEHVKFTFYQAKRDKDMKVIYSETYSSAVALALWKVKDKRCKNYEYYIEMLPQSNKHN